MNLTRSFKMVVLMKALFAIFGLALPMLLCNASAQVSVDVTLDQQQFLPGEALQVAVHVTNHSGQTLHLGDTGWLSFIVESDDGSVVPEKSDPPVKDLFTLGTSEVAIKHVDLAPYFDLQHSGSYKVIANVHIKDWNTYVVSAPATFDVIEGAQLWSQLFGIPDSSAPNQPPRVRKYSLVQANYLHDQLRLYVQVTDESAGNIVKVRPLCQMISFSQPEAQMDPASNLHVLCQSGATAFTYSIISPNGNVTQQQTYDYVNTRPRLGQDNNGDVVVIGGVREPPPDELPPIEQPDQVAR